MAKAVTEAKKKPSITVKVYANNDKESRAVYERWVDANGKPEIISFDSGVKVDLTDKPDLVKMVFQGINPHDIFINGERVPNEIRDIETEDAEGNTITTRKAIYRGDRPADIAARGELSDHEAELYDYIVHLQ